MLPDFIESNKERLIELWKQHALARLSLKLSESVLVNDLPEFIDEVVTALRTPCHEWPSIESARSHGRQRMETGTDIGTLTQEMVLLAEVIQESAQESAVLVAGEEASLLMRVIGRGAAASVSEYAAVRDRQVAEQAAQHFLFVAHEIRNPLHNARLTAEMLAACPQADRSKYSQQLTRSLTQLGQLIDNFLVNARLSSEPQLVVECIRTGVLADRAREDVQLQADARGISMQADVADFEIEADGRLVLSALSNLMRNAVKFTRTGGQVFLRVKRVDDHALIEVEDECGGMPDDLPPRLFRPFVQGGGDRSGHGLGLMIVKQAVEAHGGAVRVANFLGKGCCFAAQVPCRRPE